MVNLSSARSDVNEKEATSLVVSVGTSQVELKTAGTRSQTRQLLIIFNASNSTVFLGPNGVTATGSTRGIPIFKDQTVYLPIGDIAYYAIAAGAGNDLVVQELG